MTSQAALANPDWSPGVLLKKWGRIMFPHIVCGKGIEHRSLLPTAKKRVASPVGEMQLFSS